MNRWRLSLAILWVAFATLNAASAWADGSSVELEALTWTELRDRIHEGATTIIIPIGGTEQSGPAVALGKHNVRVRYLAARIAEKLGDALVAPVIAYVPEGNIDPPTEHMKFSGTITVSDKVFEAVLESAARGFRQNGFHTIVFVGDHGGYQADETYVADRLNKEWAKGPARVFAALDYYRVAQKRYADALVAAGAHRSEIGTHAGLADTSLLLAVEPSMVRRDRLAHASSFSAADGVYGGDPTRASAEFGRIGIDLIITTTVDAIRSFQNNQQK